MATVAGKKRESATQKRLRAAAGKLRDGRQKVGRSLTQRACTQCDPTQWVRIADWEIHRANYHRPGGYQYEQRKARAEQAKAAEKAQQEAVKAAASAPPPRPPRPPSKTKPTATPTKGSSPMDRPGLATDFEVAGIYSPPGKQADSSFFGSQQNGQARGRQQAATQQQATPITEAVVESMRLWAMQVPPSIPASRVDAQAAADMWRGISDALRLRVRMEQENNKIPESCTEPLLDAATRASQIGDAHMEVVRRIQSRYGETANILARPDTPDSKYLEQGA